MNDVSVKAAEYEARRFLELARRARRERRTYEGADLGMATGTSTSGALRRASMDLTRALAEMRKP